MTKETITQSLKRIESKIYTVPYDDLSDYLKGIRDLTNLINGEENSQSVASFIVQEIEKQK